MHMPQVTPLGTAGVTNILGEGIVWDAASGAFLWTDIVGRALFRLSWPACELERYDLPHRLGSFALTGEDGAIVAAFEQGLAKYHYRGGALDWIVRPQQPAGVRFNDGRVDRAGRFVAGTMVEDPDAAGGKRVGKLYRLESDDALTPLVDGIGITNSLCWSPDGATMYHADSTVGALNAYRYDDIAAGPSLLVQHESDAVPDGATVDAAGRIWVALWGGSRVVVYAANGALVGALPLPVSQPTCMAFGGPELDVLAVTTASLDLDAAAMADQPLAGDMFLFQTDGRGLPEGVVVRD